MLPLPLPRLLLRLLPLSLLLLLLPVTITQSATTTLETCSLNHRLNFSAAERDTNKMAQRIESTEGVTREQLTVIKQSLSRCQASVDAHISELTAQINALVQQKQNLLQNSDIEKIGQQIAANRQSRTDIEAELDKQLQSTSYRGLYMAILPYQGFIPRKNDLIQQAQQAITPQASADLNGIFIRSVTDITTTNHQTTLKDRITSRLSGTMTIDHTFLAETVTAARKLYYLVKVAVTPLQGKPDSATSASGSGAKVVNIAADDWEQQLQQQGADAPRIEAVKAVREQALRTIELQNNNQRTSDQQVLSETQRKLQQVDQRIATLEQEIAAKRATLQRILQQNDQRCATSPEACIGTATTAIDEQIAALKDNIMQIKEQQLFYRDTTVRLEGTQPYHDIATQALGVLAQLESSYTRDERIMELTMIENGILTNYERHKDTPVTRELERFWLYLTPTDNVADTFGVTVVSRFRMSDEIRQRFKQAATTQRVQTPQAAVAPPAPVAPPKVAQAYLTVRSNVSGDTVWIESRAVGPTGRHAHPLTPGSYTIKVTKPGYSDWQQQVTLGRGERETLRAVLVKQETKAEIEARAAAKARAEAEEARARAAARAEAEAKAKARAEATVASLTAAAAKTAAEVVPEATKSALIDNRYRDNGDGTVTDVVTKLMWQRCLVGQHWSGSGCRGEAGEFGWKDANNMGKGFFGGRSEPWASAVKFAGHTDWRLPTIEELNSLVYCSSGETDDGMGDGSRYPFAGMENQDGCDGDYQRPTINLQAFPDTPSSNVWSASAFAGNSDGAWNVFFGYGGSPYYNRSNSYGVRLVRSGQ
ncbi:DUF1566 domain-containing protein [Ectothiorhodospiraceae bacterium BW-2]|nr:DUF1566 domain-containing protein [Ectothiorhodospiraceae bacterium BW-2]